MSANRRKRHRKGWYLDPASDDNTVRYWDGEKWTGRTAKGHRIGVGRRSARERGAQASLHEATPAHEQMTDEQRAPPSETRLKSIWMSLLAPFFVLASVLGGVLGVTLVLALAITTVVLLIVLVQATVTSSFGIVVGVLLLVAYGRPLLEAIRRGLRDWLLRD